MQFKISLLWLFKCVVKLTIISLDKYLMSINAKYKCKWLNDIIIVKCLI